MPENSQAARGPHPAPKNDAPDHKTPDHKSRVLVIGAQGVLGGMLVDAFNTAEWAVTRAGRRPDADAGFRHIDLDEPETLGNALDETDLVVNVVPDMDLVAERMVLERGGTLINVSAMPASAADRLRKETPIARGTVLMNAGVAPGLTNLVAADLLAEYPEADEVELVFTVSTRGSVGPAGGRFAHRGLTAASHHGTAVIPLPGPFGRRRCLGFAEPEKGWLGEVLDGRAIRQYVCLSERARHNGLLAVNAAGLIAHVPRSAFAAAGPETPSTEPIAHWIGVRRQGERIAARTLRCNGDYRAAAASTVLFARALRQRDGESARGVLLPEEATSIRDLRLGMEHAGITVVDELMPAATPVAG